MGMGIWDRLETVIKSYFAHDEENVFGGSKSWRSTIGGSKAGGDPDFDAAYDELNDFLGGNGREKQEGQDDKSEGGKKKRPVPEGLKSDFAELGLSPDSTMEECKEAYKKLLKIHHPDRHANHEENMKKATAKTARVNASYERLMKWYNLAR